MKAYQTLTNINAVNDFIDTHALVFLFISTPNCTVCHALLPQIQHMLAQFPKIELAHIDVHTVPEVAGQFSVFAAPVLLFFVNGKEHIREARIVHTQLLEQKLTKIYELLD